MLNACKLSCIYLCELYHEIKCVCSCEGVIKYSQVTRRASTCKDHTQQPREPHARTHDVALELYHTIINSIFSQV